MKILIIRLSSIGDVILTTPIIKAFKEKYPDSQIDFLVLSQFKDAISGNPLINNIYLFDKEKNDGYKKIKEFSKELKKESYDYIFDLHNKFRSKIIRKNIGVKTYIYKKRKMWKSLLVKMHLIKYKVDNTIIKNYYGAFNDFDLDYKGEKLDFFFENFDLKKVESYKGYGVISPGASKNTKKWPAEYYGELAKKLFIKYGKPIVIIGGKEDIESAKIIKEIAKEGVIDLTGQLSLKESGALLSQSKFLVCNDSAPFHISRSYSIINFVIFGPTSPEMFDFNESDNLIFAQEKCSPCSLHGDKSCPKGHFKCMMNIKPETIFEKITLKI
ncbi:glycosyltransferase family 9 protein [Fusobacterium sp. PH5-44]|uniref:glycosyltransferase family 9 protein n=1 Tax=unclassified Fusobacterium TaxID=2648384 RepID=UPI003D1EF297